MVDIMALIDFLGETAYAVSQIFALLFYLFVVGLGVYGIASVVYNIKLAHERRRETETRSEPDARKRTVVYPSDKEVREK